VCAAGEAVDVADVADEAGGSGRADAVEVLQATAGGVDELGQLLVRRFDLLVYLDELADQLRGQPASGAPDEIARPDRVQHSACLICRQELLRAPGKQLEQQFVDAVEQVGPGVSEAVAPVDQQPQGDRCIIGCNRAQTLGAQRRHRHAVRVDRVALAALTGGEHSRPGGQLRWHVDHGFAVGDQALGDVPADAVAALDRPDPLRKPTAQGEHRLVATAISAEPAAGQHRLPAVDDLDRRRPLVRIHPDDDLSHQHFSSRKPG
jgi:hypothetical protein